MILQTWLINLTLPNSSSNSYMMRVVTILIPKHQVPPKTFQHFMRRVLYSPPPSQCSMLPAISDWQDALWTNPCYWCLEEWPWLIWPHLCRYRSISREDECLWHSSGPTFVCIQTWRPQHTYTIYWYSWISNSVEKNTCMWTVKPDVLKRWTLLGVLYYILCCTPFACIQRGVCSHISCFYSVPQHFQCLLYQ